MRATSKYKPPKPEQVLNLRKLKALRQEKGMTQAKTAELLGIQTDTYYALERGRRKVPLAIFRELCRLWDLDPFTICELLNLPLNRLLLHKFRLACKRHGLTPSEALNYFLLSFTQ